MVGGGRYLGFEVALGEMEVQVGAEAEAVVPERARDPVFEAEQWGVTVVCALGKGSGFGLALRARVTPCCRGVAGDEEGQGGEVWDGKWALVGGWPRRFHGKSPGSSLDCALGLTPWECPGLGAPGWHWWRWCQR